MSLPVDDQLMNSAATLHLAATETKKLYFKMK